MGILRHSLRTAIINAGALAAFGWFSFVASAGTVDATFNSATDVPVTANGYTATGNTVNFTLNFAPVTGTDLMVVNNTGLPFIVGTFDNLTNGQPVTLSYGGALYSFVANYYGGSGNDLVLVWANSRPFAWGGNDDGQLGINSTLPDGFPTPKPVVATGVLAGRTVVTVAAGYYHSLALCSDGTLAAWGLAGFGELGDNSPSAKLVPVTVNTDPGVSALYGKTVVAIAAGWAHSLALCSDGTVLAWGYNNYGQLGDNTETNRFVPVAVNTDPGVSALYGKRVVAIAAGNYHSLAVCSDGTVAGWGYNTTGALGDNTWTSRLVPVAVNTNSGVSALYRKTVVAVAAGSDHSLALCSDGTVAAWGTGLEGQLGNNSMSSKRVPVAVNTSAGVSALYGKTVTAIAAGAYHSLALCSDGTVAAWGDNLVGEVGDKTTTTRLVPVAVNTDPGVSALYGETVTAIAAGQDHSLALCSDGTLAAWGYNNAGQIGCSNVLSAQAHVPVAVSATPLPVGGHFTGVAGGSSHSLAVVAGPPTAPVTLNSPQTLANGTFQFAFTNTPDAFFSVCASTNFAVPVSNWTWLTNPITETSPGQFQFTDPQARTNKQRFYRVHSP